MQIYSYYNTYNINNINDINNVSYSQDPSYQTKDSCSLKALEKNLSYYFLTDFSNQLHKGKCYLGNSSSKIDFINNISNLTVCSNNSCYETISNDNYGLSNTVSVYVNDNIIQSKKIVEDISSEELLFKNTYNKIIREINVDFSNNFNDLLTKWYSCVSITGDIEEENIDRYYLFDISADDYNIEPNSDYLESGSLGRCVKDFCTTHKNVTSIDDIMDDFFKTYATYNSINNLVYQLDKIKNINSDNLYKLEIDIYSKNIRIKYLREEVKKLNKFLSNLVNNKLGKTATTDSIDNKIKYKLLEIILIIITIIILILVYFKYIYE